MPYPQLYTHGGGGATALLLANYKEILRYLASFVRLTTHHFFRKGIFFPLRIFHFESEFSCDYQDFTHLDKSGTFHSAENHDSTCNRKKTHTHSLTMPKNDSKQEVGVIFKYIII
jgi:hypothetical protein